jgi:SAM-dependent methyltransferase
MTGSVPTKLARLATDLILHPSRFKRYVAHNVRNGRSPLDLELPWFSYAAIDFLDQWLQADMTVCEYGSGGSTLFFARRVKSVFTIEDNPDWFDRVRRRLEEKGVNNVTLKLCLFDFKNPEGFERSTYLHAMPDTSFDVIVIDTTEEWIPVRPTVFAHAEARIRSGGVIVLDDSWRYPALRARNLKSAGPGRPGVTTTDVFFY